MKIGELASRSGCSIQTIRYYEQQSLLPSPKRSEGNFRLYDTSNLEQLMFIKSCRRLDLALDEIRGLIALRDTPDMCCNDINTVIDAHLTEVMERINELQNLQHQLKTLRRSCSSHRKVSNCGILQHLAVKAQK